MLSVLSAFHFCNIFTAAAFQAGKIQSNPFTGQQQKTAAAAPPPGAPVVPGGARVPPPQNYASQTRPPGFQPGMGGPDRPPRPGMMNPGPMMMRPGAPPSGQSKNIQTNLYSFNVS